MVDGTGLSAAGNIKIANAVFVGADTDGVGAMGNVTPKCIGTSVA